MQVGSIVIMIKPLEDVDKNFLVINGITRWPVPSNDIYHVVEEIVEPSNRPNYINGHIMSIAIDSYPEMRKKEIYMDITCFVEVLPPLEEAIVVSEPEEEPIMA